MRFTWTNLLTLVLLSFCNCSTVQHASVHTIGQFDLSEHLNSKATSLAGENDGVGMQDGSTYPSAYLPTEDYTHSGVKFRLPTSWDALERDNVRADSQVIRLVEPAYVRTVHLLASGEDPGGFLKGESVEQLSLSYAEGHTTTVSFELKNWYGIHWTNKADIRTPHRFLSDGQLDYNVSHIFQIDVPLPPYTSNYLLSTIQLPDSGTRNALHVFAMSYTRVAEGAAPLSESGNLVVIRAEAIRDWEDIGGVKGQIVEVAVTNPNPFHLHHDKSAWITDTVTIDLASEHFQTLRSGKLHRLMPGDQMSVQIVIGPTSATPDDVQALEGAVIRFHGATSWTSPVSIDGSIVHDWTDYTEDWRDLEQHRSPAWFNGAKFGIFLHWGLYSVPAWADDERYAEWYGYWLHGHEGDSAEYHGQTYGQDFRYDDFIPQFTGSDFNASAWVDLFAEAGAKYFVLTTKHHDGFALFDTKETSQRSSVNMGPKRDFLRELMTAAEQERPELGKGTYYSMPEWWNPSYQKYGKQLFAGGLSHDPYNDSHTLPYDGYLYVNDYIEDIQLEQMKILAKDYRTDLMWCDIGLANHSSAFAAEWFAEAAREGRHVSMNNRGDFATPEMTQFTNAQVSAKSLRTAYRETQKWETCSSMDPHSFGFNKMTKPEAYRNATNIIHYLIDIVGGNLLLNVGPTAEGVIIKAMADPLLEAGQWLKTHGEAIYNTEPSFILPELRTETVDIRFTRTPDAIYVISLRPPSSPIFVIPTSLPIMEGDALTLLGRSERLHWTTGEGQTSFYVENMEWSETGAGIAWVFKIEYRTPQRSQPLHDEL